MTSSTDPVRYVPVPDADAEEQIAIGVHTGLRKGSEAPSSGALWKAISLSDDSAWSDAVRYCVQGLDIMGYKICKVVEEPAVVASTEGFACYCQCHLPMGFKLAAGEHAPPGMVPCQECTAAHAAWEGA